MANTDDDHFAKIPYQYGQDDDNADRTIITEVMVRNIVHDEIEKMLLAGIRTRRLRDNA